ncbi:MAG: cytochrome P450 [Oscillospiraceae bacterium]|nr:cytochrome P450 [Oscillospiraceae bacterium]
MSSKSKIIIGWVIIIVACVLSLLISARSAIFDGEPLSDTGFIWTLITCFIVIGGYFSVIKISKK